MLERERQLWGEEKCWREKPSCGGRENKTLNDCSQPKEKFAAKIPGHFKTWVHIDILSVQLQQEIETDLV